MLVPSYKMRGFTLVELLIALVIMGLLLGMGARSFRAWIQNQQIRVAAESILNGMQLARGEAVKRNGNAAFFLCGDLTTATPDSSWDVLAASAPGVAVPCSTAPSGAATGWERVQRRSGQEGSRNALVGSTASLNAVAFNGFGRVVIVSGLPAAFTQSITKVDVTNPQGGDRPLSIMVSSGGSMRMCDSSLTAGSGPLAC